MMSRALVCGLALLLLADRAEAQFEDCESYRGAIAEIVANTNVDAAALRLVDVGQTAHCFTRFAASTTAFDRFVRRFESSRIDKEQTAGAAGAGATSIVAQGTSAKVLSAAYEYGALTRTVEKQVVTFRGNLAGLPAALVRSNVFPYCAAGTQASAFCVDNSLLSWLRRVSFSASFDAARNRQLNATAKTPSSSAPAQPVTFTADRSQLSTASLRVEIWNHRDVTSKTFSAAWKKQVAAAMDTPAAQLLDTVGPFAEGVQKVAGYDAWQKRTTAAIRAAAPNRDAVVEALRKGLTELVSAARAADRDFDRHAQDALEAYNRFFLAEDELIDGLAKKNLAAVEYTLMRPVGEVDTHTIRFILDAPLTGRTKVLVNAAASFYGKLPQGVPEGSSQYRDAQAGVQIERSLGDSVILGPASIAAAGYYQYQHAPALLKVDPAKPIPGITFTDLPAGASTVFAKAGNIVLGQVKLTVKPSGSSVQIPLSMTVSNRTELIDKPTWRAQVGLSYDLDALLGVVAK